MVAFDLIQKKKTPAFSILLLRIEKGAPSEIRATEHPLGRIIGGHRVNITDVPWHVSLQRNGGIAHFCGGSIIGAHWILTAAHCLRRQTADDIRVRVGATHVTIGGHLFRAEKLIVHDGREERAEKTDGTRKVPFDFDFGLIRLATRLVYGEAVRPIGLPNYVDTNDAAGSIVSVNGWGRTKEGGHISAVLLGVTVPIVEQAACEKIYEAVTPVTARMICAGWENGGNNSEIYLLVIEKSRFCSCIILCFSFCSVSGRLWRGTCGR